jgi:hypothetical protein
VESQAQTPATSPPHSAVSSKAVSPPTIFPDTTYFNNRASPPKQLRPVVNTSMAPQKTKSMFDFANKQPSPLTQDTFSPTMVTNSNNNNSLYNNFNNNNNIMPLSTANNKNPMTTNNDKLNNTKNDFNNMADSFSLLKLNCGRADSIWGKIYDNCCNNKDADLLRLGWELDESMKSKTFNNDSPTNNMQLFSNDYSLFMNQIA